MNTNLIATTHKSSLRALSYQGILVSDCFHQVREIVRTRLGDEYALLFAEPSFHQDGDAIDWYTPVQGEIRLLTDLSADEQNTIRASLAKMAKEILRLAEEIQSAGSASQLTRGNVLELALQYPDETCLFVVGGQPVFTCWGFASGTPGVSPQELMRLSLLATAPVQPAAPEPEATPPPVTERGVQDAPLVTRRYGLWWWLLPLLLFLLLLLVLFGTFGKTSPLVPLSGLKLSLPALPFSPLKDKDFSPELAKLKDEENRLNADLLALNGQLTALAAQCVETPPVPAPVEKPAPEALVIPENTDDLSFLKGQWLCDRGLYNKADRQPIIVIYEFDGQGRGRSIIRQQGKADCEGPAIATLSADGVLRIEVGNQVCPDKKGYSAETIECKTGQNNTAACLGRTANNYDWGGSASFYRIVN